MIELFWHSAVDSLSVVSAFISIAKHGSVYCIRFLKSLIDRRILVLCHLINVPILTDLSEFLSSNSVKIGHHALFQSSEKQ